MSGRPIGRWPMSRFEPHPDERPAVVTGASSGIGTEAARALADAGLPVVLGARRLDVCEDVAAEIRRARRPGGGLPLGPGRRGVDRRVRQGRGRAVRAGRGRRLERCGDPPGGRYLASGTTARLARMGRLVTAGRAAKKRSRTSSGSTCSARTDGCPVRAGHGRARPRATCCSSRPTSSPTRGRRCSCTSRRVGARGLHPRAADGARRQRRAGVDRRPGPTLTGMGMDWDPGVTGEVLDEWVRWGLARHSSFLRPSAVAAAIVATVTAPRGTHLTVVEVHPEAPVEPRPRTGIRKVEGERTTDDDGDRVLGGSSRAADGVRLAMVTTATSTSCGTTPSRRCAGSATSVATSAGSASASATSSCCSGADANEFYFRAPEETLHQAEAYPFMTPIFGPGVVFDAPPERAAEMLHNQSLRDKFMRGHVATIAGEIDRMVAGWGERGDIDLLDWFAELTIHTSSACLVGRKFRTSSTAGSPRLYHDLERGTVALAYVDPYAPNRELPPPRRGPSRARRPRPGHHGPPAPRPRPRRERPRGGGRGRPGPARRPDVGPQRRRLPLRADEVTGMFISMMFAGHHRRRAPRRGRHRAAPPPRRAGRGRRASCTTSTPMVRRSATRRCGRSRGPSRRSSRRCGSTHR